MNQSRQTGFTLVELMIALVLGLIVAGGIMSVFVQGRQSYRVDEQIARMQDEARFALDELSRDIRMSSYLAEPLAPSTVFLDPGLVVAQNCGPAAEPAWIFRLTSSITGQIDTLTAVDNATGASAAAAHGCIGGAELNAGSDIVAVKRVAGGITDPVNLEDGRTYLRSNGTFGLLYTRPAAAAVPGPANDWEYRPRVYYIRNFSDAPGDGIPALCRKELAPAAVPAIATECIARGIEDLQVEFGLDTNADGTPNRYVTSPTLADMQQVVTARIFLLARTHQVDTNYTDTRTYQLSNAPAYTPNDNFHRRLYSVTVTVYNRRNLRRLGL
jgi:prepilin-type N-terminal cleavage/methylation domain-containing protein